MKTQLPPPPDSYSQSHKRLGPTLHKLGLSCGQFADLSLQAMDRGLTRRERFRYRFHFRLCAICRDFEKQVHSINATIKASFAAKEFVKPDPEFLDSVRAKLSEAAKDQNQ